MVGIIRGYLNRGFLLSVLLGLLLLAAGQPYIALAASEKDNQWQEYPIPTAGSEGEWVITSDVTVEGSAVTALAVSYYGTIYAAAAELSGNPLGGNNLFKSTDDGYSWSPLWKIPAEDDDDKLPGDPASQIISLILPDWEDEDTVFLATQYNVYRSTNGGDDFKKVGRNSFYQTGATAVNGTLISSLDVAYYHDSYLAVLATSDPDSGVGDLGGVYFYDSGQGIGGWRDLEVGNAPAGLNYDVLDVAFARGSGSMPQILALVSNDSTPVTALTSLEQGYEWGQKMSDAVFGPFPSFGGDIAIPDDFDPQPDDEKNIFFAGISAGAASAVYMITPMDNPYASSAFPMFVPDSSKAVYNLAIAGENYLSTVVAGLVSGSVVFSSVDEGLLRESSVPPSISATASNAFVVLGGFYGESYVVYAATSGDNGGFAVSNDSGDSFNLRAFICDDIQYIYDVAISPVYDDDETIFMVTQGHSGRSMLWRSTDDGQHWNSVLTEGQLLTLRQSSPPVPVGHFERVMISPNYVSDTTVFLAETGADPLVWRTVDNGFHFEPLKSRTGMGSLRGWVALDNRTLLLGDSLGDIYRTDNWGKTWEEPVATGLSGVNMLVLSPEYDSDETLLACDDAGDVAVSEDGGVEWRRLDDATGMGSGLRVCFSPYFGQDATIYAADAATDSGLKRYRFDSTKGWQRIDNVASGRVEEVTSPSEYEISGLLAVSDGLGANLYAAKSAPVAQREAGITPAEGGLARSLNPSGNLSVSEAPVFEMVNNGLNEGEILRGLWSAPLPNGNRLWSVNSASGALVSDKLYTYRDTLGWGPELVSPLDEGASGRQYAADLKWQALDNVDSYHLQYATDAGFAAADVSAYTGISHARIPLAGALESGETYYWRVRVGQEMDSLYEAGRVITAGAPVISRYSEVYSLTTALGESQWSPISAPGGVSPEAGASGVSVVPSFQWNRADWADGYEFELSSSSEYTPLLVSRAGDEYLLEPVWVSDITLEYVTTYYWRVRAVSNTSQSQWAEGIFTTEAAPVTLTATPAPAPPPVIIEKTAPLYLWLAVIVSALLSLGLIVLIVITRRRI